MIHRAACPRLVLPAMQAAGLVAELLSVASEDEIAMGEIERLRVVQEGLRKSASLLGGFIRGYKKAVASRQNGAESSLLSRDVKSCDTKLHSLRGSYSPLEFESRPWPASQEGEMVTKTITDQFAFRFFPRPLHGFGRALAISTWHPNCWRAHSVTPPRPWVRRILLRLCGLIIGTQKALKPDPVTTYHEALEAQSKDERRERTRRIRELDTAFSTFFRTRHGLRPRATSPDREHAPTAASFAE